jgi:transposase-like protein
MQKSAHAFTVRRDRRAIPNPVSEDRYTATSPCPCCKDRGPHEDNGFRGAEQTFLCTACHHQFDAVPC